ncbi:hypothetical protein K440DRAFT_658334 [Wilcoxina mikolae CBS 423.85]|nr:hypothetical protein K440DRAFT_658334 [Wilcoxina mikolae CBS 423.85]
MSDDRKERTVKFSVWKSEVKDGPSMRAKLDEFFGDNLEHCYAIGWHTFQRPKGNDPGNLVEEDLPITPGLTRWTLRRQLGELLSGKGGVVELSVFDEYDVVEWNIWVMVKDKNYLRSTEGVEAIIEFGRAATGRVSVEIPPGSSSRMSFEEWCDEANDGHCGYIDGEFGEPEVFCYPPTED